MKLYHATPIENLENIRATGLDPDRSKGKENSRLASYRQP